MEGFTPTCPRCGYDQSGAVATWGADSCPLTGRCVEYGYEPAWRDVLGERYRKDREFYETSPGLRSLRLTALRSLRPWAFWRWVRMEFEPSPLRMAVTAIAATVLGVVYLATFVAVCATILVGLEYALVPKQWATLWPVDAAISYAQRVVLVDEIRWGYVEWYLIQLWIAVGIALLSPLIFAFMPGSLRAAKVRPAHIVRVWGYSLGGYLPAVLAVSVALTTLQYALGMAAQAAGTNVLQAGGLGWVSWASFWLLAVSPAAWWIGCWWWGTMRYMKVRDGGLVAVLAVVFAVVASLVLMLTQRDLVFALVELMP